MESPVYAWAMQPAGDRACAQCGARPHELYQRRQLVGRTWADTDEQLCSTCFQNRARRKLGPDAPVKGLGDPPLRLA